MKNWKKNAIVASILVFVCAGIYLNWLYTQDTEVVSLTDTLNEEKILGATTLVMSQNNNAAVDAAQEDLQDDAQEVDGTVTDYFAAVRLSRQQSRDSAVTMLQEAMAYGEEADASSASAELEEIVSTALCEAQIESLVIAKGYTDCVAYMSEDGISVAVAAPEEGLQEADVALISDIVLAQADYSLADIRIVEVK
ncbi:MAG TPA: SpoIIIAH-like family protein [Candidatus Faecousia faecigallinarum]|nr:SpoIIIAH-like family protein [Candidatus Faecousia faecigallinarum]